MTTSPRSMRAAISASHTRSNIASTADGGVWVLGTPRPEPLAALAGHRRVLDTAHRLVGNAWGDEGLTREQRAWVADPT